jgi:hypothetical protein
MRSDMQADGSRIKVYFAPISIIMSTVKAIATCGFWRSPMTQIRQEVVFAIATKCAFKPDVRNADADFDPTLDLVYTFSTVAVPTGNIFTGINQQDQIASIVRYTESSEEKYAIRIDCLDQRGFRAFSILKLDTNANVVWWKWLSDKIYGFKSRFSISV